MFEAMEISEQAIRALRGPVRALASRDPDLARQIKRAGSSIPMNIAEGRRRVGRDRKHHWRVAAGSAAEVRAALRTAIAWGDLDEDSADEAFALLDRVIAMLWKMTR